MFEKFKKVDAQLPGNMQEKKPIGLIIAIIAGISVFFGSLYYLQGMTDKKADIISIPVAAATIPQGAVIKAGDIGKTEVTALDEGICRDESRVVGKTAVSTIYQGEPFHTERVGDTASDKQLVTINVDLARSGLVEKGDLVDIYLMRQESSWAYTGSLVAVNATVHEIRDASGNPQADSKGTPAVIQVMVSPAEVSGLVKGSAPDNANYALVKKFKAATAPVTQTIPPEGDVKNVQSAEKTKQ